MYKDSDLDKKQVQFDALKIILKDKALLLKTLTSQKEQQKLQLSNTQKQLDEVETEIRNAWSPFVTGADDCSLKLGEVTLILKPITDVKMDDSDVATEWLSNNGYKDVMKWQIHNQTFKKIALELYREEGDGSELIPGCTYTNFNKIKVK